VRDYAKSLEDANTHAKVQHIELTTATDYNALAMRQKSAEFKASGSAIYHEVSAAKAKEGVE